MTARFTYFSSFEKKIAKQLFGGLGKLISSLQTESIECKERKLKLFKIDVELEKSHFPYFLSFHSSKNGSFIYLLHVPEKA